MGENNKSYRIRTVVGQDGNLTVNLDQNYDIFEVLSIKIKQEDTYKLHSSNYGVIVGRVLANEGFGVPNAKISVFIQGEYDASSNTDIAAVYPYQTTMSQGKDGVVYNLLPDNQVDDCHQVVGTFPNKTYLLDNDILIEVFDTYYKYTTRTNNSGDYIICGVPTGQQTIHMDLDLSDCGILSQRPRDFVYKGYTIEQFENPNQFKTGKELSSLSQIFRQDAVVNVIPFWGNEELGETIGITRADINVNFKFEPTCVFMGCLVGDNSSNGVSKKCIATNQMGAMDELVTGEGTIEMIRKTANGDVEEFQIKGTQLIDGNGVWCYQIPMNLDYMMTDEYGNMVPTDDPTKGIPTRARVRFRISMQDNEQNYNNYFRAKVLVPHNPQSYFSGDTLMHEDYDYEFGTYTKEESFRDLFWNNVYTVKSYIPRFQKSKTSKSERFTGIKHCNIYGQNNPMPYNNIRIKLPLMFTILCVLIKTYVLITGIINSIISGLGNVFADLGNTDFLGWFRNIHIGRWYPFKNIKPWMPFTKLYAKATTFKMNVLSEGLCPDLENWYFAPIKPNNLWKIADTQETPDGFPPYDLLEQTFLFLQGKERKDSNPNSYRNVDISMDGTSIDESNAPDDESDAVCLTINTDYLMSCIEMNLAQEYKVINFDFYNDWVNGAIYMPRWMRFVRKKRTFLFGLIKIKPKVKACMDDSKLFGKTRYYTQQCSLTYTKTNGKFTKIDNHNGCMGRVNSKKQNCHKNKGLNRYAVFGSGSKKNGQGNGGIVHEKETMLSQYVYYFKPCEWRSTNGKKTILFANDLVLLGSLNDCNLHGVPQAFKYLTSSSYIMPTNLALTNMDDDGYLYADDSGTMCNSPRNINKDDDSAKIGQLDTTFSATTNYYSTSPDETVKYGNSEEPEVLNYDDTIPLTEAAGISWNYTGPGQGTPSNNVTKSLYYPGGHFLGLSCVNSMTNIKSCINLQRICEAGSTMSQRREEVRSISYRPDDGNSEIYYKYFVPTGLISQDDINGTDFRSMFATMNKNRLLCTGNIDEKTGYPIYDFVYMRPNGFDGALKDRVSKDGRFNMNLDTLDESAWMKKQGVSQSDDYDAEETRQTATRTIEDASEDYYMFRLGLKGLSDEEQKDRFLKDDGSRVALPQYENSFYFYFGLKDGSTALDEFNKQFFSTCSSKSLFMTAPSIIGNTEFSKCNLTFKLNLKIENMTSPATLTLKNRERNQTYVVGADVTGKTTMYFTYPRNGHPEDEDLVMGTYDVEVVDNEGQTAIETINIGLNSVRINTESKNFEFKTKTITDPRDVINTAYGLSCGYIEFDDEISVWNSETNQYDTENISSSNWDLLIVDTEGNYAVTDNIPLGSLNIICTGNNYSSLSFDANTNRFYVWKADEEYDLYLIHKCEDDNRYYNAYYSTYRVNGIDNYDLYLGSKYLPYSTKLKSKSGTWWSGNTIGNDTSGFDNWAMRHALFRQTDNDSDAFTNNVISLDNNGKVIDTALFGQPEIYNTDSGKYKPEGNKIYYEGDTSFFNGDLSDDSIVPTWGYLAGNEEVDGKRLPFEEMAMYNGVVASDKIGDYNATFSESGNRIKITASLPSSVIDGNGCIVKLEDGTFVYPVREGTSLYYYGELPEDTSQKISIYPVFVFPVMYKPFYGQMRIVDWAGSRLMMTDIGLEEEPSVSDDLETFLTRLDVYNGITYKGEFEDSDASSIFNRRLSDNAITKTGDNGDLDGGENRHTLRTYTYSGRTESLDMYSFSVKEGSPIMSEEEYAEINTPYKLELASIEGNMSNDLPTYINYKYDEFNDIIFVSDNDGSAADFYLVKGNPINPLKEQGAIGLGINSSKGYVLGKFNQIANSTCSKNKVGEDVVVEINGLIATVQMYLSSDAETVEPRNVIIGSNINFMLNSVTKVSGAYTALSNIGVDIQFNYVQDILNYNNLSTYTDITPSNSVIKINLGKSNNVSIQSGDYIIGVASEPSGEKGFIKVARIYSNIMQIQKYNPPTEIGLQIEPEGESGIYPSATENTGTTFISTGGELQIRIKATGSWKFVLDGDGSFKIKEGSNLVNSTTGTGNTYLTIKASENTSSDDKAATGTATSLADESVTSYTSFLLKGRAETNYIEAETITTFGDGGGQLGIKVISNKSDGWTLNLTNLSSDNWIKFSNNSNTITGNGNSTVYVIANANGTQNERNARVRIDDCVGGNYELSFTQEQNQGGISLIVSPLSLHFNKEGSTQYITVACNSTWETSIDASWATIYNLSDRIKVVCDPNNGEQRSCNITISSNGVSKVVNVTQDDGVEKYIRTRFNVNSTTFEEKNDIEITVESNTSWRLTKEGNPDWFKISGGTQTYDGIGDEVVNCSVTKNLGEARTCVIQTRATLNDCIPVPETTPFFQNSSEYMFVVTNNSNIVIQRISLTTNDETLIYDESVGSWETKPFRIFNNEYNVTQTSIVINGDISNIDYISFNGLQLTKTEYGNFVGGGFTLRNFDIYTLEVHYN